MLLGGKKRLVVRNSSFLVKEKSKNKFESYACSKYETFLYCRYNKKGQLVSFVHIYECPMSGLEVVRSETKNTKGIYKHFQLPNQKASNYILIK